MSQEKASNKQQWLKPSYNNPTRNQSNGNNDPNLQLSVSTSKLDNIAKPLEATKKMTRYFRKSYKHNKSHHTSNENHHPRTNHNS